MLFQVAAQNATGEMGGAGGRARATSACWRSATRFRDSSGRCRGLRRSTTSAFAPTFALLALLPLVPVAVLARRRLRAAGPASGTTARASAAACARAVCATAAAARVRRSTRCSRWRWDLHTFFVPIYGARIGLSASRSASILASFAAATFAVRLLMPRIARRLREHQVLTAALFTRRRRLPRCFRSRAARAR